MSRTEILYLFPYVASLAISSGVLYYTWKRRRAQGAKVFVWLVAGRTLAIFGFILELLSPEISGKIFWDEIPMAGWDNRTCCLSCVRSSIYGEQNQIPAQVIRAIVDSSCAAYFGVND